MDDSVGAPKVGGPTPQGDRLGLPSLAEQRFSFVQGRAVRQECDQVPGRVASVSSERVFVDDQVKLFAGDAA